MKDKSGIKSKKGKKQKKRNKKASIPIRAQPFFPPMSDCLLNTLQAAAIDSLFIVDLSQSLLKVLWRIAALNTAFMAFASATFW